MKLRGQGGLLHWLVCGDPHVSVNIGVGVKLGS